MYLTPNFLAKLRNHLHSCSILTKTWGKCKFVGHRQQADTWCLLHLQFQIGSAVRNLSRAATGIASSVNCLFFPFAHSPVRLLGSLFTGFLELFMQRYYLFSSAVMKIVSSHLLLFS